MSYIRDYLAGDLAHLVAEYTKAKTHKHRAEVLKYNAQQIQKKAEDNIKSIMADAFESGRRDLQNDLKELLGIEDEHL